MCFTLKPRCSLTDAEDLDIYLHVFKLGTLRQNRSCRDHHDDLEEATRARIVFPPTGILGYLETKFLFATRREGDGAD